MDYQEDPWNTPDLHKGHKHTTEPTKTNGSTGDGAGDEPHGNGLNGNELGHENSDGAGIGTENGPRASQDEPTPGRTTSTFTTAAVGPINDSTTTRQSSFAPSQSPGAWGGEYFPGPPAGSNPDPNPFGALGGSNGGRDPGDQRPVSSANRTFGSGRTGAAVEEHIVVTLLPEKEGMFLFQHHNYEVGSSRRGSKVIRRYSDFVWLLDCLHKRYPFRVLPLLPPKRVAGMFNVASLCMYGPDADHELQSTAITSRTTALSSKSVAEAWQGS